MLIVEKSHKKFNQILTIYFYMRAYCRFKI